MILTPVALAVPLGLASSGQGLAPVTGQVRLDGHPVGDTMICFDSSEDHIAQGWLGADGGFRLYTRGHGRGAVPGTYHVHLLGRPNALPLPSRFRDPATSGLKVEVTPDWNDFSFELH